MGANKRKPIPLGLMDSGPSRRKDRGPTPLPRSGRLLPFLSLHPRPGILRFQDSRYGWSRCLNGRGFYTLLEMPADLLPAVLGSPGDCQKEERRADPPGSGGAAVPAREGSRPAK